jgi:Methionine synthase I (cobalamin-dependent), methyltransferase domain
MKHQLVNLEDEILLCDGAMGTMIQKSGILKPGEAPELLNITHPEDISAIHRLYIEAGSKYIGTNTFGGNRIKLETHGLIGEKVREVNFSGVNIAKQATGANGALVAASLGPTGKMMEPLGDLSFNAAYETFYEQCKIFAEAGADVVTVETMTDLQETKAAILAALDVNLPVVATVSFMENGRLLSGQTPEMMAATLSGFPLLALGTNCGLSASLLKPLVQKIIAFSQKPVIVQPNAGKPSLNGNETVYLEPVTEYVEACLEMVHNGVRIIGGCCGTTPDHIRLLKKQLDQTKIDYKPINPVDYLVGKNSIISAVEFENQKIWSLKLTANEPLWQEFCKGNPDPFIDQLIENSHAYDLIEFDCLNLDEANLQCFQELVAVVTTYWSNPFGAKINSESLIKTFLTGNSGRSYVICDSQNNRLIQCISKFGGIYRSS